MKRLLTAAAALALAAAAAGAQDGRRPTLPRGADPNDWEAYFDLGASLEPTRPDAAEQAFLWAARLDPSRSEPLFALWAGFHLRNPDRFARYLRDDPRVVGDPAVMRADSFRWRAYLRNPFVHRGLEVLLYDQLPGEWANDGFALALVAYARAQNGVAADRFDRLADRNARYRMWAVLANVSANRGAPARAHLETMLAAARAAERERLVRPDESPLGVEYALGLLCRAQRDPACATAALERTLLENAAFYPARLQLAEMALERGDGARAVEELALAVEVAPEDGYLRFRYGVALAVAGRWGDAAEALVRAGELEPYYAEIDAVLGLALDRAGDVEGARRAYERFLSRAPRSSAAQIQRAVRWQVAHPRP